MCANMETVHCSMLAEDAIKSAICKLYHLLNNSQDTF